MSFVHFDQLKTLSLNRRVITGAILKSLLFLSPCICIAHLIPVLQDHVDIYSLPSAKAWNSLAQKPLVLPDLSNQGCQTNGD